MVHAAFVFFGKKMLLAEMYVRKFLSPPPLPHPPSDPFHLIDASLATTRKSIANMYEPIILRSVNIRDRNSLASSTPLRQYTTSRIIIIFVISWYFAR